jgi:acyl carrier protein
MTMASTLRRQVAHREAVLARVRQLLIDRLKVARAPDEIDPDTSLFGSGLGLDSIDAVELMVCLEADLGVTLPNNDIGQSAVRTVGSLVDLVLASEQKPHASA